MILLIFCAVSSVYNIVYIITHNIYYKFFNITFVVSVFFFSSLLVLILLHYSESNSLSPPYFGNNGSSQKGRPRKRKLMINQHQNDPLNLGTAMQMGMLFQ